MQRQDGISTFELGVETFKYYKEFGVSGQIDMALLDRLKNMENYRMRIDIDFLREQLDIINKRLVELDVIIKSSLGDINLNSPKQKVALFESFGLDTGVKTKTGGAMSTGREAVENMIVDMENVVMMFLSGSHALVNGQNLRSLVTHSLQVCWNRLY